VRNHQGIQACTWRAARQSAGLNGFSDAVDAYGAQEISPAHAGCATAAWPSASAPLELRRQPYWRNAEPSAPGDNEGQRQAPTDQKQALTPRADAALRPEDAKVGNRRGQAGSRPLRGRGKLCRNPIKRIVRHGLGSVALLNNPRLQDRILPCSLSDTINFCRAWLSKRSASRMSPNFFSMRRINRISDKAAFEHTDLMS